MEMSRKRISAMLGTAALLATGLTAENVSAQEAQPVYTMTVIVDTAQGHKVAAGKYDRAIARLTAKKSPVNRYSKDTNLCVAYTKTGDIDNATEACEAAVEAMRKRRVARSSFSTSEAATSNRVYLALALSNLGVLEAVKGDAELARKRFEEALELDAGLSAPKVNLARLARS